MIKELDYDGLVIGNHELYSNDCTDLIADDFAPYWNGTFLISFFFALSFFGILAVSPYVSFLGWNVAHSNSSKSSTVRIVYSVGSVGVG